MQQILKYEFFVTVWLLIWKLFYIYAGLTGIFTSCTCSVSKNQKIN